MASPVTTFDDIPFLSINHQSLSLGQALRYLQLSGRLNPWLREIVGQHVIHQALQEQDRALPVSLAEFEAAIAQFRQQKHLNNPHDFEQWLVDQNMTYEIFQRRMALGIKLEKFKAAIAAPDLDAQFQSQKGQFSEVDLYCILGSDRPLLEQIANGLRQATLSINEVIHRYERINPPQITVINGLVPIAQLPEDLRSPILHAAAGDVLGPYALGEQWVIVGIQQLVWASLDSLRSTLEEQLFQAWLSRHLEKALVEFSSLNASELFQSVDNH